MRQLLMGLLVAVDPLFPNCVWIVGQYADNVATQKNWGTYIAATSYSGGCDSDNDSIADFADDSDTNGVMDAAELACGSNYLVPSQRPERIDLAGDQDGDGQIDEPLPPGTDGWDCDGDGWPGSQEAAIGTNDQDACGNNGWPADLAGSDNRMNIADMNSFLAPPRGDGSFSKFGHPVPDANDPSIARWNLDLAGTGAGVINIADMNALNPAVNAPTSRPPMFFGQPAFFTNAGLCPWPP